MKNWGGKRPRAGRKKQDGYVTTFQGRKSAPDGRWQRDKKTEIPMLFPLFWKTYESITLDGKDRNRKREYWIEFLQRLQLYPESFENISPGIMDEIGADPLFIRDDFNALWAAYYERVESELLGPIPRPFHGVEFSAGHRPVVWWFGAIDCFVKDTGKEISLLDYPDWNYKEDGSDDDQTKWLREHGFLTEEEKLYLEDIRCNREHRREVNYLAALRHGTDWQEFYKADRSEYLKKNPGILKKSKRKR